MHNRHKWKVRDNYINKLQSYLYKVNTEPEQSFSQVVIHEDEFLSL